ncbi:L-histidine N(alpha)-methyltransferase [Pseudonocardia sp. H11422]|uniref:L-histidine N(alpha)-methyltransferase n=1 Tax=Pseudonocardia sp. H11422 TaxID=2835866 RepID=UPI001BDCEF7C|nr:L-histidine N(alpha)-methyltransferase [Pseudonocardia sp. H11422]
MQHDRVEIVPVDDEAAFWDDGSDLLACLRESPPRVPPRFGYDAAGSELFEQITELPDYYLTRVEYGLLERHREEIADRIGHGRIAELGSGSAKKTTLLLAACTQRRPTTYLPIDVSREMLEVSSSALTAQLPDLRVEALWGRYEAGLAHLRDGEAEPVTVAFLGSNLGNTTPAERTALLTEIAGTLRPGDGLLVSVDLRKPGPVLEACYNDRGDRSAFARFRLNHLTHLNRRFGADFALEYFYPRAHYDPDGGAVEGHLYATEDQSVVLPGLDLRLDLATGDSINVGFSYKFHRPRFVADVTAHGFVPTAQWIDAVWQYGIFLFERSPRPS